MSVACRVEEGNTLDTVIQREVTIVVLWPLSGLISDRF